MNLHLEGMVRVSSLAVSLLLSVGIVACGQPDATPPAEEARPLALSQAPNAKEKAPAKKAAGNARKKKIPDARRTFSEVMQLIADKYVDTDLPEDELWSGAIDGVLRRLIQVKDREINAMLDPAWVKEMKLGLKGSFSGVGVVIKVIEEHKNRLAIILSHGYLYYGNERYNHLRGGQRASPYNFYGDGADGEMMWNQLVRKHPNVMMVICGHLSSQYVGYRKDKADHGNLVHQMLVDYEKMRGGNGFLRVLEFLPDVGRAYHAADLVLCRSGASTVAECAALGVPAVFVPYPWHRDHQQEHNAAEAIAAVHHACMGVPRLINQMMTEAIDCAEEAEQMLMDEQVISPECYMVPRPVEVGKTNL